VRLLDALGNREEINAGSEFTQFIPVAVIRQMLGFPEADEDLFREFVHVVLEAVDLPEEERIEAFAPIEEYFIRQIEDHQANPANDLTSYLLDA
jgi:cytochrome P450